MSLFAKPQQKSKQNIMKDISKLIKEVNSEKKDLNLLPSIGSARLLNNKTDNPTKQLDKLLSNGSILKSARVRNHDVEKFSYGPTEQRMRQI